MMSSKLMPVQKADLVGSGYCQWKVPDNGISRISVTSSLTQTLFPRRRFLVYCHLKNPRRDFWSAFYGAKSAHEKKDKAYQQGHAKPTAADGRTAKKNPPPPNKRRRTTTSNNIFMPIQ
jgi:hypothetical protein